MAGQVKLGIALLLIASALLVVGSFLPWATFTTGDTSSSPNGFSSGSEGWWTLGFGSLMLVAAVLLARGGATTALAAVCLAISLAAGIVTLLDMQETQRSMDESRGSIERIAREAGLSPSLLGGFIKGGPAAAIWVLFVGAAAGIGGSLLILGGARPASTMETQVVTSDSTETKICPRCAETVKAAAQVCRFCGHEFIPTA